MPTKNPYSNPEYQRNRKRLLSSSPICAICQRQPATQADHIIERDAGGTDDYDNLQPVCAPCNARKGQRYATSKARRTKGQTPAIHLPTEGPRPVTRTQLKTAQRPTTKPSTPESPTPRKRRPKSTTVHARTDAKRFLGDDSYPERPNAGDVLPGTDLIGPDRPLHGELEGSPGLILPRLETARWGGDTFGPSVAGWAARHLGIDLMPWQVHALSGALEHDGGRLRHRVSGVSVARQQGKTVAQRALIGWWVTEGVLVRGGPQTVISTAHTLDLAAATFYELAPVLEEKFGFTCRWSYGRNEAVSPDGKTRWLVRAATPAGPHGRSPDLIVADELWDISSEVIDQGFLPSQRARPYPLASFWSTAGTESSTVMLRLREQAQRLIDTGERSTLHWAEWSCPPGVDIMGRPDLWPLANPAIGYTITAETLEAESRGPERSAFLRGMLNMWVSATKAWLPPGLWADCQTETPAADLPPATVLAVDSSPDGSRYVGVFAHPLPEARTVIRVGLTAVSELELWDKVAEILPAGCHLAVTPSLWETMPRTWDHRRTKVGYKELLKWTVTARAMILEGRVSHLGETQLAEHMNRAVAADTPQGIVLASRSSPGPIELARVAVFALVLASKVKPAGKPQIVTSRAI